MAAETWRRDIPQWHNVRESAWASLPDLRVVHGIEGKVLSRAKHIEESASLMLRLPAGWKFSPPVESSTLEMFVIDGSITANGTRLTIGGFVAIPGGKGGVELSAPFGAQVLVFWNQFRTGDCYPDGVSIRNTIAEEWTPVVQPGIPHGTFFKPLRVPYFSEGAFGGPAGNLTLVASLPAFHTHDGEHHEDAWEEIIFLSGDTYFPTRGRGGPGTVTNNPSWFHHGPFGTQRGHVAIMQAVMPLRVILAPLSGGPQAMGNYLDTQPLIDDPLYTDQWRGFQYKRD